MSRTENDTDGVSNEGRAAEYVLGTLRGIELSRFVVDLAASDKLQQEVRFWESQLFKLNSVEDVRPPLPDTWKAIEQRVKSKVRVPAAKTSLHSRIFSRIFRGVWLPWSLTAALAAFLFFNISTFIPLPVEQPPVDYVAVMTDTAGSAKLSTTARASDRRLWLHWQNIRVGADQALQLWAISRIDGTTQSLLVLANSEQKQIELSEAQWGLIKDAESLLLTIEAPGGSVTNIPSDMLVARGICIRVSPVKKTT